MDTALTVPTIDVRQRIPMAVIRSLALSIAEKFQPQRIILFGSYAYGQPRPESDVDLLVTMDTPFEWLAKAAGDLATARRELRVRKEQNFDAVCFHAQQSAGLN